MASDTKFVTIGADRLRRFAVDALAKAGVDEENASCAGYCLVEASLRGTDSHGIRLLPIYVKRIKLGLIARRAELRVVGGTSAGLIVDGGNGLGQVVAWRAMEMCIERAQTTGFGFEIGRAHV